MKEENKMFDFFKKKVIQDRATDEVLYEYVLNEIEKGIKVRGLWAKAMANSDGIESKTQSIYMKYRVQSIKDAFTLLQIEYNNYSKNKLFAYISNELFNVAERRQEEQLQKDMHESWIDGEFNETYKEKLKEKGFTLSSYSNTVLKKNGMEWNTKIDYDNMLFLVIDPDGKIAHQFQFEVND